MYMILMRMFIAIIDAHYIEISKNENGVNNIIIFIF